MLGLGLSAPQVAVRRAPGDILPFWPSQQTVLTRNLFTGVADGTNLEAISGWTRHGGAAGAIKVNSARLDLTTTTLTGYSYETGSTTRYIQGRQPTANNSAFPICGCVIDENNFYGCRITGTNLNVGGFVGGSFITDGDKQGSSTVNVAVNSTIRMEIENNSVARVYANNVLLLQKNIPSTFASCTKVGAVTRNVITTNTLDDVEIATGTPIHGAVPASWNNFTSGPISANGKTWIGATWNDGTATTAGGKTGVCELNNSTGTITQYAAASGTGWDNDHASGSVLLRPDGRLIYFYSRHVETAGIRFRVSVNAHDASAWSQEYAIADTVDASGVCYPTPVMLSAEGNRIRVFYRAGNKDWTEVHSDDLATATAAASNGSALGTSPTWSTAVAWIPGGSQGLYARVYDNGADRIDFYATDTATGTTGRDDVRHCYFDGTNLRATDGTSLGAPGLGAFSSMTAIATSGAPDNLDEVFIYDGIRRSDGTHEVVFMVLPAANDIRYWYARWDGSSWTKSEIDAGQGGGTPDTRTASMDDPSAPGQGYRAPGICLDQYRAGYVYIGIGGDSASRLWRYRSRNQGASWTRTEISPPQVTNARFFNQNISPRHARGGANLPLLWCRGRWGYFDFTNVLGFSVELMETTV